MPHNFNSLEAELFIDELTDTWEGKASYLHGGKQQTVHIPTALPQEHIRARIWKKRRRWQGQLLEILKPSAVRIPPRCTHFGQCGGCQLQHLPYTQQWERKVATIHALFAPFTPEFLSPIPCSSAWHYRNKMEFTFFQSPSKERFLGLYRRARRSCVIDLHECYIAPPWCIDLLEAVRAWWSGTDLQAFDPPRQCGLLRTLTVRHARRTGARLVILQLASSSPLPDSLCHSLLSHIEEAIGKKGLSLFLCLQHTAKAVPTHLEYLCLHGPAYLQEKLHVMGFHPLTLCISPAAFAQPNPEQAEELYAAALRLASLSSDSRVLDLYCGTAAVGMLAAQHARRVIGVEVSTEAVQDAKQNLQNNCISNMEVHSGDVGHLLSTLDFSPDLVFLDPPRAGLSPPALRQLLLLRPSHLLYISCNPSTQARDVQALVAQGYRLVAVQPIDQFPQTAHCENLALLIANL